MIRLNDNTDLNILKEYGFIVKDDKAYYPNVKDKNIIDILVKDRKLELATFDGLLYNTEDIYRTIDLLYKLKEDKIIRGELF